MKKHFWLTISFLVVVIIGLAFFRTSSIYTGEQVVIASWQKNQPPAAIRFFQITSDSLSFLSLGIPVAFLLYGLYKKERLRVRNNLMVLLAIGLSGLMSYGLKTATHVPRPYEMDAKIKWLSEGGGNSFPSGHTVEATTASIGFSSVLFPTPLTLIITVLWTVVIMLSRVILGVHSFIDVGAGVLVGVLGFLVTRQVFLTLFPIDGQ